MSILFFNGQYRWLSNFYPCSIVYKNKLYPSLENAYQAAKVKEKYRDLFLFISAGDSKKLSRKLPVRKNWEKDKLKVMRELIAIKFKKGSDLAQKLLETGDQHLEEGNWWGDKFWGKVKGEGENMLGIILMGQRNKLKCEK